MTRESSEGAERTDDSTVGRTLFVLMRDGTPVRSQDIIDIYGQIGAASRAASEASRRLQDSSDKSDGLVGYRASRLRQIAKDLEGVRDAVHAGAHRLAWHEVVDGQVCAVCTCGVLVPGEMGRDFTLEEFLRAERHYFEDPFLDPPYVETDRCPRCGKGYPSQSSPGVGKGFVSMTLQRAWVCNACFEHQMHRGYRDDKLGKEVWPVHVPKRFYDMVAWPRR